MPDRLAFTDHWGLRATMVFERRHPKQLQMSLTTKREILRERGAIRVWLYAPGRPRHLIGETYGVPVEAVLREDDDEGKDDVRPFARRRALYVYSTTILRRYEGLGYAKILKAYFLARAFQAGYCWAVGHAKEPDSVGLNLLFGAQLRRRYPNWSDTGLAYRFFVQRLR